MAKPEGRLILRIRDLAPLLGCSEVAARRMIEAGAIPARRWGRRIVILREELETHLRLLPGNVGQNTRPCRLRGLE